MTITVLPARNEYTATAAQTVFNYTFKIFENTDLNVYITPVGQEANDSTDLTTAYTVDAGTIGDEDGGFITMDSGVTAGSLVTIVSDVPESRTTDYQFNGDFIPDTVNADFDRVVQLTKQVEDTAGRTLTFQQSQQNATALTLPEPDVGLFMRWKADLSGLENVDLTSTPGATNSALVIYMAGNNFTGGIDRTVENKFRDIVSVNDFGAVAGAESSAAIQAAIDSGATHIEFPDVYLTDTKISGGSNCHLHGAGGLKSIMAGTGDTMIEFLNQKDFSVKGLSFEGLNDPLADDERAIDVRATGTSADACTNFEISGNRIKNIYTGIKMGISPSASTVEGMVSHGRVFGNDVYNSFSFGIVHFAAVAHVSTFGNNIDLGESVGISVEDRSGSSSDSTPCRNVSVTGNTISNIQQTGLKLEGSYGCSYTGNTIMDIGEAEEGTGSSLGTGISVRTISQNPAGVSNSNVVSGNTVVRCRQNGIQALASENNIISNNTVKDWGVYRSGGDDSSARAIKLQFTNANGAPQGANKNMVSNNIMVAEDPAALTNRFVEFADSDCVNNSLLYNTFVDLSGNSINEFDDSATDTVVGFNNYAGNQSTLSSGQVSELQVLGKFALERKSLSGGSNLTFPPGEATIYSWSPSANVNFDPIGTFEDDTIKIIDNRSGSFTITFDSAGLADVIR